MRIDLFRTLLPLATLVLVAPAPAFAQVAGQPPSAPVAGQPPTTQGTTQSRSWGLPSRVDWTFNLDAGWGTFGFANSFYQNPKEGVAENLSDQWFEGFAKPAVTGAYTLASSSQVYGKVSVVGEQTYGSAPEPIGQDVSSFRIEDLSIGWRSGKAMSFGENAIDVSVGRIPYTLGHGMLLWDGAAEGGSRGGYWTNARKALQFGALATFKPGPHKAETFYLDRDDLREYDTGTKLWGVNYEYTLNETSSFGATYMRFGAHQDFTPQRDGLNVFNFRAYTAPLPTTKDVSFEFEYAAERNGDVLNSDGWTLKGSYVLSTMAWKPTFSYRYAEFPGDNPETAQNEQFDPLLPGFYDWGTWWQGEIAGEYFLPNSNTNTHQIRAHVTPKEAISGGLIFYQFRLDRPDALAADVTNKNLAWEFDFYADWQINANFTASGVFAFANPQTAAQQLFGRTDNFVYGMLYVAYRY
jgi:hypothetical protein